MESINKFVHSKFDIHPSYTDTVYFVTPVDESEHMKLSDRIEATVAKFKECDNWFIYVWNVTRKSADILNLGEGDTKYVRSSRSDSSPEMVLYNLINKGN